ncbi:hypothetical protein HD554DRAFT_2035452 [Boletus coccyginus]|nr:hypothetical protein HD554DRAFT_2035452 [Boletus coccyginus]
MFESRIRGPSRLSDELEKKIFELAAWDTGAVHYLLVTKHVHLWLEPHLYCSVTIHRPCNARLFISALKARPHPACHAIKALCLQPSVPPEEGAQILWFCEGVESLMLQIPVNRLKEDNPLIEPLDRLPLTHLSLNLSAIFFHPSIPSNFAVDLEYEDYDQVRVVLHHGGLEDDRIVIFDTPSFYALTEEGTDFWLEAEEIVRWRKEYDNHVLLYYPCYVAIHSSLWFSTGLHIVKTAWGFHLKICGVNRHKNGASRTLNTQNVLFESDLEVSSDHDLDWLDALHRQQGAPVDEWREYQYSQVVGNPIVWQPSPEVLKNCHDEKTSEASTYFPACVNSFSHDAQDTNERPQMANQPLSGVHTTAGKWKWTLNKEDTQESVNHAEGELPSKRRKVVEENEQQEAEDKINQIHDTIHEVHHMLRERIDRQNRVLEHIYDILEKQLTPVVPSP